MTTKSTSRARRLEGGKLSEASEGWGAIRGGMEEERALETVVLIAFGSGQCR